MTGIEPTWGQYLLEAVRKSTGSRDKAQTSLKGLFRNAVLYDYTGRYQPPGCLTGGKPTILKGINRLMRRPEFDTISELAHEARCPLSCEDTALAAMLKRRINKQETGTAMDLEQAFHIARSRCRSESLTDGELEKIAQAFARFRVHRLVDSVISHLKTELSLELTYHSADHTEEVLFDAIMFACLEDLPEREIELLSIGAAYHDIGFLEARRDNERLAAELAEREMREDGDFSDDEIALVGTAIRDTQLMMCDDGYFRQTPSNRFSRFLLDADMSNLGRPDFFHKSELHRREVSQNSDQFFINTLRLLEGHAWHTDAAKRVREKQKKRNQELLHKRWSAQAAALAAAQQNKLSHERVVLLSKLPALLNAGSGCQVLVNHVLDFLVDTVRAEAATVFLSEEGTDEVSFYALEGGKREMLEGLKMPAGKGIVGWVIQNQRSTRVDDVTIDPRFFGDIDKESSFKTRNMICAPLMIRGKVLGAVQVLNKMGAEAFGDEDLQFLEEVGALVAMAIDNARSYEQLEHKNAVLQEMDKRKSEFLSILSHEFRTPLNVIQTAGELISSVVEEDDARVTKANDLLKRGVARLLGVFMELRNLTYVTGGSIKVRAESVSIAEITEQLRLSYADPAKERGIELELGDFSRLPRVIADQSLITTVLLNLVSNALKYTDSGGIVTFNAVRAAGLIEISVSDTGIGIDPQHLPSIFEKFYEVGSVQGHGTSKTAFKGGGLGIGLAAAKAIVEAHGSSLDVESEVGKGTRFSFRLRPA
jgi:signal transduction histidine kinase